MKDVLETILHRRAIRRFDTARQIDEDALQKILQAGLAWLESTKDACGNTSTYTYVSGHEAEGRLDKITDPVGRVTQFSYNSDGLIASIAIPAAEIGRASCRERV